MSLLDTVAGMIGSNESADAQQDALRRAYNLQQDIFQTSRADLAPYRDTGVQAQNVLAQTLLGTPQGQRAPFDLGAVRSAVPQDDSNILRRISRVEEVMGADRSAATFKEGQKLDKKLAKRTDKLRADLSALGLSLDDFPAPEPEPAQGPSLDAFEQSPEFQLAGPANSRAMQDTMAALSAAGLRDSGAGARAVFDRAQENQLGLFNNFLGNRGNLASAGQNAAVQSQASAMNFANQGSNILQTQGVVRGARDIALAEGFADIGNQAASAAMAGFGGGGGFNFSNALRSFR